MRYFAAISAGPELANLRGESMRVLAVLSNALYLCGDGGHVIGIAGASAEDGPVTLRVEDVDSLLHLVRGRATLALACTEAFIELPGTARIELGAARQWQAEPHGAIGDVPGRLGAVRALLAMLNGSWCNRGTCGLAACLFGPHHSLPLPTEVPLLRAGSTTGDLLLRRLARGATDFQAAASELDIKSASTAAVGLLGLGVGLTPSGDDLLAGIVASLVWQARLGAIPADFAQRLVGVVRRAARDRTNGISARLLWHAGDGLLYAPAMELGAALLAGDVAAIAEPARRLLSIGHSSGADMATGLLAGIVAGIEIEARGRVPSC